MAAASQMCSGIREWEAGRLGAGRRLRLCGRPRVESSPAMPGGPPRQNGRFMKGRSVTQGASRLPPRLTRRCAAAPRLWTQGHSAPDSRAAVAPTPRPRPRGPLAPPLSRGPGVTMGPPPVAQKLDSCAVIWNLPIFGQTKTTRHIYRLSAWPTCLGSWSCRLCALPSFASAVLKACLSSLFSAKPQSLLKQWRTHRYTPKGMERQQLSLPQLCRRPEPSRHIVCNRR